MDEREGAGSHVEQMIAVDGASTLQMAWIQVVMRILDGPSFKAAIEGDLLGRLLHRGLISSDSMTWEGSP
jgi:hypothetical protein